MRSKFCQRFERLEDRRLLTVVADVDSGDLVMSGTPDGLVEIVATDSDTIDVIDDGELIASLEGVNDDIRIDFSGEVASNDEVVMRLEEASIDRIMVNLGNGSNRLVMESGNTNGGVRYSGGSDDDSLEVSEEFVVGRGLSVSLGDGDNTVDLSGSVERSLRIRAGSGDDLVRLSDTSEVGRRVSIRPGAGDNTTLLEGGIGGSLYYRGGGGDDLIDILASATIEGRSTVWFGDGDNDLNIDGSLESHLYATAGDGDDEVTIGESASIDGNVRLRLGDGEDAVDQSGELLGRLRMDDPTEMQANPEPAPAVEIATSLLLNDLLTGSFEFRGSGRIV